MHSKSETLAPDWLQTATDRDLLTAMQQGQIEALREIYRRYERLVYSLACKVLKTPEEAEDLTQEIFLKLWQRPNYNPDRGTLSTYLCLITRSRAIDRLRSQGARYRLVQRWHHTHPDRSKVNPPLEQASLGEQAHRVRAALADLAPAEQEILEIAYYEGLSQSQIAQRLEIPLGTVKTRSRQALKKLRRLLQDLI